jgi:ABC-type microcin C transport system permease subunit YejE
MWHAISRIYISIIIFKANFPLIPWMKKKVELHGWMRLSLEMRAKRRDMRAVSLTMTLGTMVVSWVVTVRLR